MITVITFVKRALAILNFEIIGLRWKNIFYPILQFLMCIHQFDEEKVFAPGEARTHNLRISQALYCHISTAR